MCGSGGDNMTAVPITDVKPDIFRHVLYYVYGGKVSDEELKANAKDLIDAADKFGVVNLKLEAEACYVKSTTLTTDNMLDNLLYADSKNCALLKEAIVDFIVKSGDDIINPNIGKVSFDNLPGPVYKDLLRAMAARWTKKGHGRNILTRLGNLGEILHEKGFGGGCSREKHIALYILLAQGN
mmetsp:Transcript_16252/g.26509  ORF Transcript_16252/g.26509 Transcript_16252/m.26509 type:complete len:182 (-) Transcript_16252:71-616(-)